MLRNVLIVSAIGAVSLGFSPTVSLAQQVPAWSGFNVSVGGGASKSDTSLDVSTANNDQLDILVFPPFPPLLQFLGQAAGAQSLGDDEWTGFGTLQAGYDQRFGNVVVGGFANYDFYPSDQSSSASNGIDGTLSIGILPPLFVIPGIPIANYASVTSNVELKNTWSVGARLGYLLTPNTLIYGLGGYTEANFDGQIDLSYLNLATGPQTLSLRVPNELHGYFLGAGGEVKVSSNVALRLEYRYANYSGETSSAEANFTDTSLSPLIEYRQSASVQADLDAQIQSVRGAVVLQLGQP